ncbi:hypothetical protein BDR07DRAFT_1485019 [Suillus spraguei]|nr:hypothetical protein BDR07DRAFT_1485019 [Suillus spraguei]
MSFDVLTDTESTAPVDMHTGTLDSEGFECINDTCTTVSDLSSTMRGISSIEHFYVEGPGPGPSQGQAEPKPYPSPGFQAKPGPAHHYWQGYGAEADIWVPGKQLEGMHQLEDYQRSHSPTQEKSEDEHLDHRRRHSPSGEDQDKDTDFAGEPSVEEEFTKTTTTLELRTEEDHVDGDQPHVTSELRTEEDHLNEGQPHVAQNSSEGVS